MWISDCGERERERKGTPVFLLMFEFYVQMASKAQIQVQEVHLLDCF